MKHKRLLNTLDAVRRRVAYRAQYEGTPGTDALWSALKVIGAELAQAGKDGDGAALTLLHIHLKEAAQLTQQLRWADDA